MVEIERGDVVSLPFDTARIHLKLSATSFRLEPIEALENLNLELQAKYARIERDLGERAVRYNLKILDELGFTKKQGYNGRMLTPVGLRELDDALVDDRIGFVNTRIEEYMCRTSFDIIRDSGDVIVNTSLIDKNDYECVASILKETFDAGYTISRRVLILDEYEELASLKVAKGCLGIATLCSITLDGMLMKKGISANTSFAGVIEVREGMAAEFTDLIAYAGSSLDPMRVFMARRVTRVADAVRRGSGRLLANVREIPLAAAEPRHFPKPANALLW